MDSSSVKFESVRNSTEQDSTISQTGQNIIDWGFKPKQPETGTIDVSGSDVRETYKKLREVDSESLKGEFGRISGPKPSDDASKNSEEEPKPITNKSYKSLLGGLLESLNADASVEPQSKIKFTDDPDKPNPFEPDKVLPTPGRFRKAEHKTEHGDDHIVEEGTQVQSGSKSPWRVAVNYSSQDFLKNSQKNRNGSGNESGAAKPGQQGSTSQNTTQPFAFRLDLSHQGFLLAASKASKDSLAYSPNASTAPNPPPYQKTDLGDSDQEEVFFQERVAILINHNNRLRSSLAEKYARVLPEDTSRDKFMAWVDKYVFKV